MQALKAFISAPKASKAGDLAPNISIRGTSREDYLAKNSLKDYRNLNDQQANHKVFDFFDSDSGHAVSAKTMDTLGLTNIEGKPMTPENAEKYLRSYIREAKEYEKAPLQPKGLYEGDIRSKSIELAIPHGTSSQVREALERAATWGRTEGVQVHIVVAAAK